MMDNKKFWLDVFERVIKTFCQTWAALLVASGMSVLDGVALWDQVQVSLLAALASLLTGIAGSHIGAENTAAWLPKGPDTEKGHVDVATVLVMTAVAIVVLFVGIALLDIPTR